jgi:hypothetical protein
MPLVGSRRQPAQPDEAAERVRKIAEAYQKYGLHHMPVSQVLDLLKPDGDWTRDAVQIEGSDPRADPITGALPVTAPPKA